MKRNSRPMSAERQERNRILLSAEAMAYQSVRGANQLSEALYTVLAEAHAAIFAELERNAPSTYFLRP